MTFMTGYSINGSLVNKQKPQPHVAHTNKLCSAKLWTLEPKSRYLRFVMAIEKLKDVNQKVLIK
jgi:hypothetical protein